MINKLQNTIYIFILKIYDEKIEKIEKIEK